MRDECAHISIASAVKCVWVDRGCGRALAGGRAEDTSGRSPDVSSVKVAVLRRWGDGDRVAKCFELSQETAGYPVWSATALVVVGTQVGEWFAGCEEVPDDVGETVATATAALFGPRSRQSLQSVADSTRRSSDHSRATSTSSHGSTRPTCSPMAMWWSATVGPGRPGDERRHRLEQAIPTRCLVKVDE